MRGSPLARRAPWTVALAALLVVPGTFLSVAMGAVGAAILLIFAADFVVRGQDEPVVTRRLPVLYQLIAGVAIAAVIGLVIAIGAWIRD